MGTIHGYKTTSIPCPDGYGTRGYPYPWVKLPSLFQAGQQFACKPAYYSDSPVFILTTKVARLLTAWRAKLHWSAFHTHMHLQLCTSINKTIHLNNSVVVRNRSVTNLNSLVSNSLQLSARLHEEQNFTKRAMCTLLFIHPYLPLPPCSRCSYAHPQAKAQETVWYQNLEQISCKSNSSLIRHVLY
jgi:hypothetical protein